jgi:hypothetical protein
VGVLDLGFGLFDRMRLAALLPQVDVAVEGTARLCTDDHMFVAFIPMEGERPSIAAHIDVSLQLWNKGNRRIAVLEVRNAKAANQALKDGIKPFSSLTLEPGSPKIEAYFTLSPADGSTLSPSEGDRLEFALRLGRNGRDRRVTLRIGSAR